MVGDCIESTSEDEEFWEKRLANNAQAPHLKRHGMLTRTESRICILLPVIHSSAARPTI